MKIRGLIFGILVVGALVRPAEAGNPAEKFGRGLTNILFAVAEIPHNMNVSTQKSGDMAGITTGFWKGFGFMWLRIAAGIYDIVTFPIPIPARYEPVMYPEYIAVSRFDYEYPIPGTRYDVPKRKGEVPWE